MYYLIKIVASAVLIVLISEIAKKSSFWGAILASLPFISIIAFIFLYQETRNIEKIRGLSTDVFWLVIPSLALFITLPILLKKGYGFYPSLGFSCLITVVCYFVLTQVLKHYGILTQ